MNPIPTLLGGTTTSQPHLPRRNDPDTGPPPHTFPRPRLLYDLFSDFFDTAVAAVAAAAARTCPATSFRQPPARFLPDILPLLVGFEPWQPALDDAGEKRDDFLSVEGRFSHAGRLRLENFFAGLFETPDTRCLV